MHGIEWSLACVLGLNEAPGMVTGGFYVQGNVSTFWTNRNGDTIKPHR